MSEEQFKREKNYRTAVSIVKSMLKKGVISEADYHKIDTKLVQKYRPVFGSL